MSQEYYAVDVDPASDEGTIIEHLGTAEAGSREGDELVRDNSQRVTMQRQVIVDDLHDVLDAGTRVRITEDGCIDEVLSA
jgi:hypothetical protein